MIWKNVYKLIPGFFLWIAGLSLCAHLIIPHDHHPADTSISQEESCPSSKNNTGHHSGFPVHCHAFNDLSTEKAIIFVITGNIQSSDLSLKSYTDAFVLDLNASKVKYSNIREQIPDHYLLEFSPLRAPPQVS